MVIFGAHLGLAGHRVDHGFEDLHHWCEGKPCYYAE